MRFIVPYSSACIILVGGRTYRTVIIKFRRVVLMRFIVTYSCSCIIIVGGENIGQL